MNSSSRALFVATFLVSFILSTSGVSPAMQGGRGSNYDSTDAYQSGLPSSFGVVRVRGVRVVDLDPSQFRLAVEISITPALKATLEDLRLTTLRLNGLPAFAEPITQQLDLVPGKEAVLAPLYLTVQFRELTTTAPLRESLEKQSIVVQGQISAAIRMTFLKKLALHMEHPRVSFPLHNEVPLRFVGSRFQRQAALTLLPIVEIGLRGGAMARKEIPGLESSWLRKLEAQASSNLVKVQSTYSLKASTATYPVIFDQLGFRISSSTVLVTAETQSPWAFDPEFLGRLKSGEVKLVKNSSNVELYPIGERAPPLLLSQKDFSFQEHGSPSKEGMIVPRGNQKDYSKINVRSRSTADVFGVLRLKAPVAAPGFDLAPAAIAQQPAWESVAVYRLRKDPVSGQEMVDAIELSARRDGHLIRLDHTVEPSFFGSPILVPEGVLGIVQDEQTGTFIPADLSVTVPAGGTAVE